MITKFALLICLFYATAFTVNYNSMRYNTIRIAYYGNGEDLGNGLVDEFLQKAKDNKYNYVLAEFGMNRGRNSTLLAKKEDFLRAFKRADDFGLRLIPLIQVGSCWSYHWRHAQVNWNTNIKMTRISSNIGDFGCPSFSADTAGFDQTFIELLKQIRKAHKKAKVKYPLEFIHLGHDEPEFGARMLIGDCKTGEGPAGSNWKITSVNEVCIADKSFIENYSGEKSAAVQELIISELYRRTNQVKANLGSHVRIMIYGDMWDPQLNGKQAMELWNGTIINTTPGIATLPGLSTAQRKQMRNKLIILPWNYDITADPDGDGNYKAEKTFEYLSSNGFKFIYVHEITDGNTFPYPPTRIDQANDYYNTAKKFKKYCLGYDATAWTGWASPAPKCFDSMVFLYNLNSSNIPVNDYRTP